jgi:hypothetical protein
LFIQYVALLQGQKIKQSLPFTAYINKPDVTVYRAEPATFTTGGRMESPPGLDQYIRITKTNSPSGAGSQLASLSTPGDLFWKYNVSDPSSFIFNSSRVLTSLAMPWAKAGAEALSQKGLVSAVAARLRRVTDMTNNSR